MALQHLAAIVVLRASENVEPSRSKAARGARVMGFTDAQVTALGAPRQYTEQQGVRAGDDRFAKGVRPRRTRDAPLDGRIDDGRSGDRRSAYGITMFPATPPIPNHYRRAVVYRYVMWSLGCSWLDIIGGRARCEIRHPGRHATATLNPGCLRGPLQDSIPCRLPTSAHFAGIGRNSALPQTPDRINQASGFGVTSARWEYVKVRRSAALSP